MPAPVVVARTMPPRAPRDKAPARAAPQGADQGAKSLSVSRRYNVGIASVAISADLQRAQTRERLARVPRAFTP
ncbi:hypothetical protein NBRC116596_05650 [Litorivita sp. NS0012-18]